jgi:hypothetical protein
LEEAQLAGSECVSRAQVEAYVGQRHRAESCSYNHVVMLTRHEGATEARAAYRRARSRGGQLL